MEQVAPWIKCAPDYAARIQGEFWNKCLGCLFEKLYSILYQLIEDYR